MKSWSIADARADIANVFDAALTDPQKIERPDGEAVIVVDFKFRPGQARLASALRHLKAA